MSPYTTLRESVARNSPPGSEPSGHDGRRHHDVSFCLMNRYSERCSRRAGLVSLTRSLKGMPRGGGKALSSTVFLRCGGRFLPRPPCLLSFPCERYAHSSSPGPQKRVPRFGRRGGREFARFCLFVSFLALRTDQEGWRVTKCV